MRNAWNDTVHAAGRWLGGAAIAILFSSAPMAQPATSNAPDSQTVADAYAYLLGRALVIRQERNDFKDPSLKYNQIKYNPLGNADFVNPNFDVAYLEAWFAVDEKTPVILEVPKVTGRYYTAQILDEWGEVIANINERTFPTKPYGKFALVAPGSAIKLPPDTGRIELHSNKAKMLARVELKGDPSGAVALQKQFRVTSLGTPDIKPIPGMADFNNKDLIGAEIFDHVDDTLASALDVSPVAAELQQKVRSVAAYVSSSPQAHAEVDSLLHSKIIPEYVEYIHTKAGPYSHGWMGSAVVGNYGADYRARAGADLLGIWANNTGEVVYFTAIRDGNEQPLDGGKSYVISFPPGALPEEEVNAYWSVILVSVPDYRVIPNTLKRYNLNNVSKLKREPDGGLKIAIGPKPVAGVAESNWLPSASGKPFSLTLRLYVPKEKVLKGQWSPSPITPVN